MIIYSTGEKGGVGKSTHATMLLDIMRGAGIKVAAFDCDRVNSTLTRMFCQRDEKGERLTEQDPWKGVGQVNMGDAEEITIWSDQILSMAKEGHILVDFPAGTEGTLDMIRERFRFDKYFKMAKLPWLLMFSFGGSAESVNLLGEMLENYGQSAQMAVILSDHFRPKMYNQTRLPEVLATMHGVEVHVPNWPDHIMQKVDMKGLLYSQAAKPGCGLTLAEVVQTEGYWEDTVEGFQPLIKLLGEENAAKN